MAAKPCMANNISLIIIPAAKVISPKKVMRCEVYHNEKRIPLFDSFKPWLVGMSIIIVIAYTPALIDANKNPGTDAPRFDPDNPAPIAPIETSKTEK